MKKKTNRLKNKKENSQENSSVGKVFDMQTGEPEF